MKAFAMCLALLAAVAAPAGAQSSDRLFSLAGPWNCENAIHTRGTMIFSRGNDRTVSMRENDITADGLRTEFDESYSIDPATGQWSWSGAPAGSTALLQTGSAPAWIANNFWMIEGQSAYTDPDPSNATALLHRTVPLRVVYTLLDDGTLHREFQSPQNGLWVPTSTTNCKRTTPDPAKAAGGT